MRHVVAEAAAPGKVLFGPATKTITPRRLIWANVRVAASRPKPKAASTCIISGVGVGNALGGRLLETSGPTATFALSAAIALAAALCATGTRTNAATAT